MPTGREADVEAPILGTGTSQHAVGAAIGEGSEGTVRTTPTASRVTPNEGRERLETRQIRFGFPKGPSASLDFATFLRFIFKGSMPAKIRALLGGLKQEAL